MKKALFYIPFLVLLLSPIFVQADVVTYPDGCTATTKYSATTGQPCQKPVCSPGDLYSYETGQKCSDINTSLPEGCIDTTGYSPLTGHKCDGSVPVTQSITPVSSPVSTGSQTVSSAPSVKLITKDLGSSYEFDAYLYDENGNNISLMKNDKYKYSKVVFSNEHLNDNERWSNGMYDPINGYYYSTTELKSFNPQNITISFSDLGISQTFTIADTIKS